MRGGDEIFEPKVAVPDEYSLLFAMNNEKIPHDLANENPSAARGNIQIRGLDAERLIGELSIQFFIKRQRDGAAESATNVQHEWRKSLSETLIIFFEAAIIETLRHNNLTGEIAVESFLQSIRLVRNYRGQEGPTHELSDEFCLACFRRCFSERTQLPNGQTIASSIDNEHFPFLRSAEFSKPKRELDLRRFLDEHELLIAAFEQFELLLKPMSRWFSNLYKSINCLDPVHASWSAEVRDLIFGDYGERWLMSSRNLTDVIASSEALISPSSQRNVRPVRALGHHWHLVDLGAREFISSLKARCHHTDGEALNLKAVWLNRRIEWLWWRALFLAEENLNQTVQDGLRRRNVSINGTGVNAGLSSSIEKVRIPGSNYRPPNTQYGTANSKRRVVIFGGGIAGLTAAHELSERGFEVSVIEKQPAMCATREQNVQVGGIARTQWDGVTSFPDKAENAEERRKFTRAAPGSKVPGEHGYRFFPSFYRHIFDTMKRTPIPNKGTDPLTPPHMTAFDQLQGTYEQVFARKNSYVKLSRARPRTLEGFRKEYMQLIDGLGFEQRDVARFLFKIIRYLMACPERRAAEYEDISMLEFFGGEDFYHEEFIGVVKAAPQALVAMDAEFCDARTQLNVYLQLLMDQVLGGEYTDSTLRGPTSDAWLVYWREYLEEVGVKFEQGNVLSIAGFEDSSLEVIVEWPKTTPDTNGHLNQKSSDMGADDTGHHNGHNMLIPSVGQALENADYVIMALDPVEAERVTARWTSNGVPADLKHYSSYVTRNIPAPSYQYELIMRCGTEAVDTRVAHDMLVWLLSTIHAVSVNGADGMQAMRTTLSSMLELTGEVRESCEKAEDLRVNFWMAQRLSPRLLREIESYIAEWLAGSEFQSPKFVSDSPDLVEESKVVNSPRIPGDLYGAEPSDRFQTFTGIQYYFEQDFRLVRGHVYFPETDWGLSVISQRQFWAESARDINGVKLRGILSVDIGDTRGVSSYTVKSFLNSSSKEEVALEVWRQIEDSLKSVRGDGAFIKNLPLPTPQFFHVDENLEFDGATLKRNLTPFLVNNAGDWERRPKCMPWVPGTVSQTSNNCDATDVWQAAHGGYRVHNDKVVFCGHYMRTFTRMTTMEAANESARHAVNAILDHIGQFSASKSSGHNGARCDAISGDYCDIWNLESHELEDFDYFKRIDKMLFERNKPHLADILRFDQIADVLHPEPSDLQALLAAVGGTTMKDLGLGANDLMGLTNTLMKTSQSVNDSLLSGKLLPGSSLLEPINKAVLNEFNRHKPS